MDTSAAIVDAAQKAGIKVIAFDRMMKNGKLEVFIGFDNDVIGDVIAKYAVERVSKGNYALINGDQANNNPVVYRDSQGHDPVVRRMVRHFRQEKGYVT
jgi:D-xylose transport system substrate-binding protein